MKTTAKIVKLEDAHSFYNRMVRPYINATRNPDQTRAEAQQAGWEEALRMMVKHHVITQEQCDAWKNNAPTT